jgi:hypothetical protein
VNRGLILELKQDEAIVLTPDGAFRKVKRTRQDQWQIGQEIDLPIQPVRRSFVSKRGLSSIALAASVLIIFVAALYFFPLGADQEAIAFVSMDINPSVEIGLNKALKVVSLSGLNADGEQLVSDMGDWQYLDLSEVTFLVIQRAKEKGYLSGRQEILVVTSFINDEDETKYIPDVDLAFQTLEDKLVAVTAEVAAEEGVTADEQVLIHQLRASSQTREEAKQQGLSPGKYSIYLGVKESGIDLDLEQIKGKSISDLAKELNGLSHVLSNWLREDGSLGDDDQQDPPSDHGNGKDVHGAQEGDQPDTDLDPDTDEDRGALQNRTETAKGQGKQGQGSQGNQSNQGNQGNQGNQSSQGNGGNNGNQGIGRGVGQEIAEQVRQNQTGRGSQSGAEQKESKERENKKEQDERTPSSADTDQGHEDGQARADQLTIFPPTDQVEEAPGNQNRSPGPPLSPPGLEKKQEKSHQGKGQEKKNNKKEENERENEKKN